MTVKNAGTAISKRSHSISFNDFAINTPTMINAGAVTCGVTIAKSGEKNNAKMKNPAVTIDANPVRPPTATPEDDSTNEVVVDVPTTAPTTVEAASANNAFPARGSLLSFIKPACCATATSVPAVSKKSTNKNVKMTTSISSVKMSPKRKIAWPNVSEMLGGALTISPMPVIHGIKPKIIPATEVIIMP